MKKGFVYELHYFQTVTFDFVMISLVQEVDKRFGDYFGWQYKKRSILNRNAVESY